MVSSATGRAKPKDPLGYLATYRSPSTVKSSREALRLFLESVYGKPIDDSVLEKTVRVYLAHKRDNKTDVEGFLALLQKSKNAPLTMVQRVSLVKTFLMSNSIDLGEWFWKTVSRRIGQKRPVTVDEVASNGNLRRAITHMPVHGKAMFLLLSSSGLRIGECLHLTVEDVDLNTDPVRVTVRAEYTKGNYPRTTFASREAKEAIEEWLKVRSKYLEAAVGKSWKHVKSVNDPRLFPFTAVNARTMYNNALKSAGLHKTDPRTQVATLHPHTTRKFFQTRMTSAGVPPDMVGRMMGHEGYLTKEYLRYTPEQLAEYYQKGEPSLLLFTEVGEVEKFKQETEELTKGMQIQLTRLTVENEDLKGQLSGLRKAKKVGDMFEGWSDDDLKFLAERLRGMVVAEKDVASISLKRKSAPADQLHQDLIVDFHD